MQLFHQSFKYLRAGRCWHHPKYKGRRADGWMAREDREEAVGSDRTGGVLEIFFEWKIRKIGESQKLLKSLAPCFPAFPSSILWKAAYCTCLLIPIFKIIMFSLNELIQAFDNNIHYAWEILYAEILMETSAINTEYLRKLVILYSKGVEKCNHLQDTGESYFKNKINQLMGQRKVIQCLNDDKLGKRNHNGAENVLRDNVAHEQLAKAKAVKFNPVLQARKKEIEMRLAYDIEESKTNKLSKMLKEQKLKQEKLQSIVVKCMSSQEEKLKRKIEQRKMRASLSGRMTASLKLQTSGISTYGQGIDSYQNLEFLDELSFISTEDHYV